MAAPVGEEAKTVLGHPDHPIRPTHVPRSARPTQLLDHALGWAGAVLATLPLVATVGFAIVGSLMERRVPVDWLMPRAARWRRSPVG